MPSLHEQYRPRCWEDVVGQDKALRTVADLRKRGLGGRAVWISGQSGVGKTTIGKLMAAEIADDFCIEEYVARSLSPAKLDEIARRMAIRGMGKGGRVAIINESHGLSKPCIEILLDMLERIPEHSLYIFTTTVDGMESLFEEQMDSHPLLSRCNVIALARRDLAKPFAERARMIAQVEGLDGQPIEKYVRLMQTCRNNLRAALQEIENGTMIER